MQPGDLACIVAAFGEDVVGVLAGHAIKDELKAYSGSGLSAFELPKRFFFLTHLARTEKEPTTGVG